MCKKEVKARLLTKKMIEVETGTEGRKQLRLEFLGDEKEREG